MGRVQHAGSRTGSQAPSSPNGQLSSSPAHSVPNLEDEPDLLGLRLWRGDGEPGKGFLG